MILTHPVSFNYKTTTIPKPLPNINLACKEQGCASQTCHKKNAIMMELNLDLQHETSCSECKVMYLKQ